MVLIIGILIIIVETNKKACKEKTGKGPRFIKQNIKENVEGTEQSWGPCMELEEPHQKYKRKQQPGFMFKFKYKLILPLERRGGERGN